jgi:hypothetical protein
MLIHVRSDKVRLFQSSSGYFRLGHVISGFLCKVSLIQFVRLGQVRSGYVRLG